MCESNIKLNTSEIHLNFETEYYRYYKSVNRNKNKKLTIKNHPFNEKNIYKP